MVFDDCVWERVVLICRERRVFCEIFERVWLEPSELRESFRGVFWVFRVSLFSAKIYSLPTNSSWNASLWLVCFFFLLLKLVCFVEIKVFSLLGFECFFFFWILFLFRFWVFLGMLIRMGWRSIWASLGIWRIVLLWRFAYIP